MAAVCRANEARRLIEPSGPDGGFHDPCPANRNPSMKSVDLYRSAWVLMKQHGTERALAICDEREASMRRADDVLGCAAWRGIRRAIEELDAKPTGEALN